MNLKIILPRISKRNPIEMVIGIVEKLYVLIMEKVCLLYQTH